MEPKISASNKSDSKDVWVFFALTLLISWVIWIFMILFIPSEGQLPVMLIGGFGPFISAIITLWIFEGKMSVKQWLKHTFNIRINPIWYVVGGLLLPILIGLTHHAAYLFAGGKSGFSYNQPWGIYVASLISTTLLGGGNEEPGWRGFATPRLMKKFHPIIANVIVSIFWVGWCQGPSFCTTHK